jgi:AraC-like DNA-binding protein
VATADDVATFRLSTEVWPERERAAGWREQYGRMVLRLEVEPLAETAFRADVNVRLLSDLALVSGVSSAFKLGRTRELIADGSDELIFQIASSAGYATQLGRETAVTPHQALLFSSADVGTFTFLGATKVRALRIPRNALRPLLRDFDAVLVRPIAKDDEALRLLGHYLRVLDQSVLSQPELQHRAVTHVYDLVAVALGANREAAEIAKGRGVRAARLRAIKGEIIANLGRPTLSVTRIAERQHVSARYLQLLFEEEGTTFTEFLRRERLARARRMLSNPRYSGIAIGSIAFEVGFGDLSYFNRAFRRLYGASPSDIRAGIPSQDAGAG